MAITLTKTYDIPRAARISRDYYAVTGYFTTTGTYATNGFPFDLSDRLRKVLGVYVEPGDGYNFLYDYNSTIASAKLVCFAPSGAGTTGAGASHTHAVALDGGATGAGDSHTHAVALDGGATGAGDSHTHGVTAAAVDAEAAHTHAVALDSGASAAGDSHTHALSDTTDAEAAHTHAVALDTGASAAGDSHNHAFTGTAIATDTFIVAHDATPETAVLYAAPLDGVHAYLNCDNSADNADDYFETAGGERVWVDDNNAATVGFALYFDEDAASADSRILFNNTITATDMFVRTSGGKLIRLKHSATAAADGVALYFNDDGADATLRLNGILPGAANITTNATDDSYRGMPILAAGTNAAEATHTHASGTLADAASGVGASHTHGVVAITVAGEATHTHASGTLADVASGVGASHTHGLTGAAIDAEATHTHGFGTLADAASGAEATHTHDYGTLVDAASDAEATHTHAISLESGDEFTNGGTLTLATGIRFVAFGLK